MSTTGLVVLLAALAVAVGYGLWWRSRQGRVRTDESAQALGDDLLARLGAEPSDDVLVTLVQLSSPHCAPCRATSAVLAGIAAEVPGVRHRELDISSQPELVGALDVLSTPTTLVVDAGGRVRGRAVGTPAKQAILQVVRPLAGTRGAPNAGNSLP